MEARLTSMLDYSATAVRGGTGASESQSATLSGTGIAFLVSGILRF